MRSRSRSTRADDEDRVPSYQDRRIEFGARMRQVREDAGLNGGQLADRLGWLLPKLSKLEHWRQTASDADLDAWIAALAVPAADAARLRAMLGTVREAYESWREQLKAGIKSIQEDALDREANARLIRAVDVGVVPGLVQTADYARAVLLAARALHGGADDITEGVRARMRRQQILFEPGRSIELLMTESALLHPLGTPEVMAAQVHRLIAAIGTPNVRVGVLPAGQRLPYPLVHGYWIVDHLVMVETITGESHVSDPDEVGTYMELTDRLWAVAAEGDQARALLAAHWRG
ncbi:putative DNA-binding protein [Alloactinosynnema sp. L-07]|nr:putative DNA-binding protein [Alloactinosynnema sp. L-07]